MTPAPTMRERRADPGALGRFDMRENQPESAEGGDEARDRGRAERRQARHAGVLKSSLRVAARADIHVRQVAAAKQVSEERADHREQDSHSEADRIDKHIHKALYKH